MFAAQFRDDDYFYSDDDDSGFDAAASKPQVVATDDDEEMEPELDDFEDRPVVSSRNQEERVLITKAGYEKMVEELKELKSKGRKEVAARIKEAIAFGDLSENAEYEEAKNAQAFLEGRILELEEKVKNAEIIKSNKATIVQLGAKVKIKDLETGQSFEYTIVGSTEADPMEGRISNESPVGSALLERKVNDEVTVITPKGRVQFKIESMKY
jgi:transcription elongation factor GreA